MGRRERLERRAELRGEWAVKAAQRSATRLDAAHQTVAGIPMGQPILVGHHSERRARRDIARMTSHMNKGVEQARLAEHHASKAEGIARQLDRTIFDDDDDAIERLEERVRGREASAALVSVINKAWRKGGAAAVRALVTEGTIRERTAERILSGLALCPWLKTPCSATGDRAAIRTDKARIERIKGTRKAVSA